MDEQATNNIADKGNKQQQRQLRPVTNEAVERLMKVREQIIQDRQGKPFEDSTELIRQMREERTRELMGEESVEEQKENFAADEANQRQRRPATRRMLEELQQVSDQIMQRRNGQLFEDSTELIQQMREERTRELMGEE